VPDWNRVRYDLLTRLGYFVTESSEHLAEYLPYFIKRDRPDLIERTTSPSTSTSPAASARSPSGRACATTSRTPPAA
jgi:alpha-galactosidase/6-phospho-beta-glucosidase family protein